MKSGESIISLDEVPRDAWHFIESAIDGTSACGKTSTTTLGIRLIEAAIEGERIFRVDSGALYRLVTWMALSCGIDPKTDPDHVMCMLHDNFNKIDITNGGVTFDGKEAGDEIRTDEISDLTPYVAEHPPIRAMLLPILIKPPGQEYTGRVYEGRDATSIVFPNADIRWYLTAHPRTRAVRRFKQKRQRDVELGLSIDDIESALVARDKKDKSRACCPLVQLHGVRGINSTNMTLEQVARKFANEWMAIRIPEITMAEPRKQQS